MRLKDIWIRRSSVDWKKRRPTTHGARRLKKSVHCEGTAAIMSRQRVILPARSYEGVAKKTLPLYFHQSVVVLWRGTVQ